MGEKSSNVSKIDAAIQAAQARKATKRAAGTTETKTGGVKTEKPGVPARTRLTDEEKAAREVARTAERDARKSERATVRAAKLAERNASRKPAHMKKVEKAAGRLGALGQQALLILNEATAGLSAIELQTLANHIQHFNRVKATERALAQTIVVGQEVTVISGDPRHIGKTGTVAKVQRIRCYVTVEGSEKPIYLFTSDVASVPAAEHATHATVAAAV